MLLRHTRSCLLCFSAIPILFTEFPPYIFDAQVIYINLFFTPTELTAVANFSNEACTTGGVKPSEPLLFTCKVYGAALLRVVIPTGDQKIISAVNTTADVALPAGFTAVSLNITEIDEYTRNFELTLSIDSASLLNGSEIKCDNTTSTNEAKAKCPVIGELCSQL